MATNCQLFSFSFLFNFHFFIFGCLCVSEERVILQRFQTYIFMIPTNYSILIEVRVMFVLYHLLLRSLMTDHVRRGKRSLWKTSFPNSHRRCILTSKVFVLINKGNWTQTSDIFEAIFSGQLSNDQNSASFLHNVWICHRKQEWSWQQKPSIESQPLPTSNSKSHCQSTGRIHRPYNTI